MAERKKQSLLGGAMVLVIATTFVEVMGVLYKIPLTELIGAVGRGYTGTAFNLYIPIYNISLAGLPVALSKLVAQYMAEKRYNDVKKLFKTSFVLFVILGVIGTGLVMLLAYPCAKSIDSMGSLPSILMVAPAVLVCCMMSTYRGYYSGLHNQTPAAISQMCEVLGKLTFGLVGAYAVQKYAIGCFESGKAVFGVECKTMDEAVAALTPYAAAASIFGVTMGAVCSLLFLVIRHKVVGDKITKEEYTSSPLAKSGKETAKMLATIAVPIVVSTIVLNITNLIDSWSIQYRLQSAINADRGVIEGIYNEAMSLAGKMDNSQLKSYLYGAYEIALDFRNLVPTITTTLGLSAIPVLSEAWTLKDHAKIRSSVESVIRVAMLISLPVGMGMAVLSKDIIHLVYSHSSSISVSAAVMAYYGCFTFVMAGAQPLINMLQAIGRADIPMKALTIAAIVKVVVNFVLVGIPGINIIGAIIGTFCFYFISVCINLTALIRNTKVKISFKSVFFKPLMCALMSTVAAWSVSGICSNVLPAFELNSRFDTSTVSALIGIVAAVIVYILALLFTRSLVSSDIKMLPKGEKICKILEKFNLIG